jgi:hypothetical protein
VGKRRVNWRGGVGQRRDGDAGAVVSWGARGKRDRARTVSGENGQGRLEVRERSDKGGSLVRGRERSGGYLFGIGLDGPCRVGQFGYSVHFSFFPFFFFFLFILFCFQICFITFSFEL